MSKQPTKRPLTSTNYLLKLHSLPMLIHITFESFIHNLNKSYSCFPSKIKVIYYLFIYLLLFCLVRTQFLNSNCFFTYMLVVRFRYYDTENEADDSQLNRWCRWRKFPRGISWTHKLFDQSWRQCSIVQIASQVNSWTQNMRKSVIMLMSSGCHFKTISWISEKPIEYRIKTDLAAI